MNTEQTIALLIDADNAQEKKMENVILEISTFGRIVVKRAYGNWTKNTLKKWEEDFRKLAIKPIQQIDYVKGKNATDIALTIDAMDFLYNSAYDIYAIVSSDSDFTPLAIKLREAGKKIIGIGKETTSEAFIQSCDNFMFIEKIGLPTEENNASQPVEKSQKNKHEELNELDKFLQIAANTYQNDDGFTNVSSAGAYIKRVKPEFNIQTYGVKKIPEYLEKNRNRYNIKKYKGKGVVNIIAYQIKNT